MQKRPVIVAFEGWDAAGKGGAIKRITEKLDPRGYVVYPISAPQGEDKDPALSLSLLAPLAEPGEDRDLRSLLVWACPGGARRGIRKRRASGSAAYKEINSFERQLRDFGVIVLKFWIHISREEQLRRFEERTAIGYKAWKLTEEDWRNREKWGAYEEAVEEMLVKTSTRTAPWCLVEGNDKYWARAKTLTRLVDVLSDELGYDPADPLKRKKGSVGHPRSKEHETQKEKKRS